MLKSTTEPEPFKIETDTAYKYYQINYQGATHVRFKRGQIDLEFLDGNLNYLFTKCVFGFFPHFEPIDSEDIGMGPGKYSITINDNCLLARHWYDIIEKNRIVKKPGCEIKLCWDFTNGSQVYFPLRILGNYVSNAVPFRSSTGIKVLSWEMGCPGGYSTKIYDPV